MNRFIEVCEYISHHQKDYKENFLFASCENWLRNEICKVMNFKLDHNFINSPGEWAFDEVNKIDLKIKTASGNEYIELKVVYPSTHKDIKSIISDVKNKIIKNKNINDNDTSEAWIFFIANSNHYKSKIDSLESAARWVKEKSLHALTSIQESSNNQLSVTINNNLLIEADNILWAATKCFVAVGAIQVIIRPVM
ncbi:hypothetical protein [uncultured Cedecea sp.]|uniref:hypothetical protein n=1 Tax=uncultured Cedecea sp. TaxID=988762 RepID=UPI0026027BA7|nr:hypothetical protein [uncultured Cedecea sp.]